MICSWYRILLILKRLLWRVNWNISGMNGRISDPCILQCISSCLLEFDSEPLCLPRNLRVKANSSQNSWSLIMKLKLFLPRVQLVPQCQSPVKLNFPSLQAENKILNLGLSLTLSPLVTLIAYHKFKMVTVRWTPPWNWWVRAIPWLQYTCEMHTIEAIPIYCRWVEKVL